jgi:hypothetical protein
MFENYSDTKQMQLELQWWIEQKLKAVNDSDLQYAYECNIAIEALTHGILTLKDEKES